jgi:hypothetical protein
MFSNGDEGYKYKEKKHPLPLNPLKGTSFFLMENNYS